MIQLKIFKNMNKCKQIKLKLDIEFLSNCKQLGVYPKLIIFKLPNASECFKMLYQYVNTFDNNYVIKIYPRQLLRFI